MKTLKQVLQEIEFSNIIHEQELGDEDHFARQSRNLVMSYNRPSGNVPYKPSEKSTTKTVDTIPTADLYSRN